MKIVCGSCQAKYSIADEKVAGKVFKIRCKRCSEVIVVRGDQEEPAASGGHAADEPASDSIWHVVVNGEQAGPYSPAQLADMINAGKLDWEAYVWSEGFENWLPMRDVPDLVTAISGPPESEPQAQPEPVRAAVGAPAYSAAQPSMGADPFADDGPTSFMSSSLGSSAVAQSPARANLFVASPAADSPFEAERSVIASAPSPRVSKEQAMTGARNENSVLFSLKNLQALATGSNAPGAPSAPAPRPGFAGGEGSGLIDIRALASATGVNDQGRNISEKDALLSIGSAQAGAFGALGSPMLAPPTRDDDSSKKGLLVAIVGGFALLAVAGIAAAVILRPAPSAAPVVAPVVPPPIAAPVAPAPAPAQPADPPSEGELAAQRKQAESRPAAAPSTPAGDTHRAATPAGGTKRPDKPVAEPVAAKPEPARTEEKPKAKGGSSSIDDLLNDAINSKGGGKAAPAAAAAPSNLPDKPSREDVMGALNGVKGAVAACATTQHGVAIADITVSGKTGRVTNVEVSGMTGEVGSCVARSVRKASFPKFKSDVFQVKFPFRI